jgi:hypothetical protein
MNPCASAVYCDLCCWRLVLGVGKLNLSAASDDLGRFSVLLLIDIHFGTNGEM